MNCNDRFEKLLDLMNGELSWLEQAELEAHIETCPICTERAESMKALETAVAASLRRSMPSFDPTADIMARLAEQQKPAVARWPRAWAIGLAMGLCIGLLIKVQWLPIQRQATNGAPHAADIRSAEQVRTPLSTNLPSNSSAAHKCVPKAPTRIGIWSIRTARVAMKPELRPGTYWVIRSEEKSPNDDVRSMRAGAWELRSADNLSPQGDAVIVVYANGNTVEPTRKPISAQVLDSYPEQDARPRLGLITSIETLHSPGFDSKKEPSLMMPGAKG